MKNILIIYPHWPPSNLAGVHRPRLISNFLHEFGWHPIILTVKPQYYEEPPDYDIEKTVNLKTEVIRTEAKKVGKPRLIGDIGLRAFKYLKEEALKIIQSRKIDFIWIPIPSFYVAVLGRILYEKTGIPYGIDYIDPWVRNISNRKNLRAILSNVAARILEPYAIKKASVISGVAENYYLPALERNFPKNKYPINVAMPYGFDPNDHKIKIKDITYPWQDITNCKPIVYAGAFLPLSGYFTDLLFRSIANLRNQKRLDPDIRLFFIGTGNYTYKSVMQYAQDYNIDDIVIEIRKRYPFLYVLNFLSQSYGVIVIGSTEKHYTASKIFQSILSRRPVFSIFHKESSAVSILRQTQADTYTVLYDPMMNEELFMQKIENLFYEFINQKKVWQPNFDALNKYSALQSAAKLVAAIEKAISRV